MTENAKSALVVDDSRVVRKVARDILEELGFSVEEAENGQEAVTRVREKMPAFILLDWNMPVMNGMEFLKMFLQFKNASDVPVIFCTTENDFSKIQEAMENGASEYVMKPFDAEIIRGKLEQLGII